MIPTPRTEAAKHAHSSRPPLLGEKREPSPVFTSNKSNQLSLQTFCHQGPSHLMLRWRRAPWCEGLFGTVVTGPGVREHN